MKLLLQSFLQLSCHFLSLRFGCYPQHSLFRHPQSISQARKTAITELKIVGAIVRFSSPAKQSSGVSAPLLLNVSRNTPRKMPGEEDIAFRTVFIHNMNKNKIFNSSFNCLALRMNQIISKIR